MLSQSIEMEPSAQPFLSKGRDSCDDSIPSYTESFASPESSSHRSCSRLSKPFVLHLLFFLIYTGLYVFFLGRPVCTQSIVPELVTCMFISHGLKPRTSQDNSLPVPARSAVHWEVRPFETKVRGNPFSGGPRPELDHAWHQLLQSELPTSGELAVAC